MLQLEHMVPHLPVDNPWKNLSKMSKKTIEHVEKPTQVVDVGMQQLEYGHVPSKENDMNHNEQWFQSDLS